MIWLQSYNPLGNVFLSTLVAALPVCEKLGTLGLLRVRAHVAALSLLVFLQARIWPFAQMVP